MLSCIRLLKLSVIFLVLGVAACSSNPSTQTRHPVQTRIASFPGEIPIQGQFQTKAIVAKITRCPRGSQCLIADHLSIVSLNAHQPYSQARGLLVFPPNVNAYKAGKAYSFRFLNGEFVSSKAL